MMEIIPSWHPVFVHFTVALLIIAAAIHLLSHFLHHFQSKGKLANQLTIVARWNLWFGSAGNAAAQGLLIRHVNSIISVIPGLARNPETPISACFSRHWIPTFAGMTCCFIGVGSIVLHR